MPLGRVAEPVTFNLRLQLAYQFLFQDAELQQAITSLQLIDRLERRLTVGFTIPHIPGVPTMRAAVDLVHLRDNFRDFGLDKNGVVLTLTWQPEHAFVGTLSSELEQNNISLFNAESLQAYLATPAGMMQQRLLRAPQGQSAIASVREKYRRRRVWASRAKRSQAGRSAGFAQQISVSIACRKTSSS